MALAVNGAFSYLGSDGLGSASVALDGSGSVQASVLYGPYGATRYSSGTMPGSYGYTGQQADATTGLDYYNARYYDASAGQFASADTAQDGLNRYGYVGGNPTTNTDPSGHRICPNTAGGGCTCTQDCGGGPPPCTQNCGGGGTPPGGNPPPGSKPKPAPSIDPLVYDQIMGLCSELPDFICNVIKSMLSSAFSMSRHDLGNALRTWGVRLLLLGGVIAVVDIIYTLVFKFNKANGLKLALEFGNVFLSGVGYLSADPAFKSSAVYGILAVLAGILGVFITIYGWYKVLSPWAQVGADLTITAAAMAAQSEAGPAEATVSAFFGNSVSYALAGFSYLLMSVGSALVGIGYRLQNS